MFVRLRDIDLKIVGMIDDVKTLLSLRLVSQTVRKAAESSTAADLSCFFLRRFSLDEQDAWFHLMSPRSVKKLNHSVFAKVAHFFSVFRSVVELRLVHIVVSDVTLGHAIQALHSSGCTRISKVSFFHSHFELAPGCRCCRSKFEKDARDLWCDKVSDPSCQLLLVDCTFDMDLSEKDGRAWFRL
jgi:hypothetical protein